MKFSLGTLNIWGLFADWDKRRKALSQSWQSIEAPGILCLHYVYLKNSKLHVVEVKSWYYGFNESQTDLKGIKTCEINKHKLAALDEWRNHLADRGVEIVTGFWVRNSSEQEAVFVNSLEELSNDWQNMKSYPSPAVA